MHFSARPFSLAYFFSLFVNRARSHGDKDIVVALLQTFDEDAVVLFVHYGRLL